jgi:hypothetical protein
MAYAARIRTGALLLALTMVFVLGVTAIAEAGQITTWTGIQPTGTVTGPMAVIISGSGPTSLFPLSPHTVRLFVDGALIPRASYTATVQAKSVYFRYSPVPALSDGPHTFRVEVADTAGAVSFREWGATFAVPPTGAFVSPISGATLYTGRPEIVVSLSDNTPGTAFTVIGQVRAGTATGLPVAAFGGIGLPFGRSAEASQTGTFRPPRRTVIPSDRSMSGCSAGP